MSKLYGIDVSMWQAGMDLGSAGYDFNIIKASEGVGYKDPQLDNLYSTLNTDSLYGFYHFARPDGGSGNTPEAEAQSFLNYVGHHVGKALFVLDWEPGAGCDGMVDWAYRWLQYVYEKTGVKPLIYMNQSTENSYDWSKIVNADYGLWLANYGINDGQEYDFYVKHWSVVAMHQYTSAGNLDKNVFFGDVNTWLKYCAVNGNVEEQIKPQPKPEETESQTPNTEKYAVGTSVCTNILAEKSTGGNVYQGDWQGIITKVIPGTPYPYLLNDGTGWTNNAGIDSDPHIPNATSITTYTVQAGDTLSGIAASYGTTYQRLAEINGISDPNVIYIGQVIKIN